MALTDPTQTITTDLQSETTSYNAGDEPWNKNLEGFNIDSLGTESSTYQCDWEKWHGLYRKIPELRSTIDTECRWIVGKKLIYGDKRSEEIAKRISGKGKDTMRKILLNIKRTSKIGGDCYCEIPKDKAGRITNIKILDPGTIEIRANQFGIIQEYAQVAEKNNLSLHNKTDKKGSSEPWKLDEIFHISNESIADEIHGIPEAEKLQTIIKMRHQAMSDYTVILHRYGKPTFFYEADTDDETEMAHIADKINKAMKNFENVVTPKGTLTGINKVSVPQYSSLDPMPWNNFLRSYFTESSNVPDLVRGKSDEVSLAAGKLNFLGYKEKIIFQQLEYSEEIEKQLGLKISFEEPPEIDIEIMQTNRDMEGKKTAKEEKKIVSGKAEKSQ